MAKRLSLVVPERTVERLEVLKRLTGASSGTDVIKQALMTYESIAMHLGRGVHFIAEKPDGQRIELEFMIDVARPKLNNHKTEEKQVVL